MFQTNDTPFTKVGEGGVTSEPPRRYGWPARRGVLVAGGLLVGLGGLVFWPLSAVRVGALGAILLAATFTDLRWGTIPNVLSAVGAVLGLSLAALAGWDALGEALGTGLGAAGLLLGVRALGYLIAGQPGMGYGDVKLGFVLGVFVGWHSLWMLYLAAVVAGVVGSLGIVLGLVARRQRVPFAPFIAVGAWAGSLLPVDVLIGWVGL